MMLNQSQTTLFTPDVAEDTFASYSPPPSTHTVGRGQVRLSGHWQVNRALGTTRRTVAGVGATGLQTWNDRPMVKMHRPAGGREPDMHGALLGVFELHVAEVMAVQNSGRQQPWRAEVCSEEFGVDLLSDAGGPIVQRGEGQTTGRRYVGEACNT